MVVFNLVSFNIDADISLKNYQLHLTWEKTSNFINYILRFILQYLICHVFIGYEITSPLTEEAKGKNFIDMKNTTSAQRFHLSSVMMNF